MLRFSQHYFAFVLVYWATAALIYYLCFGSTANISASFLESVATVFNTGVVASVTGLAVLILGILRSRFDGRKLLAVLIIACAQVPFFSGFHMIKVCIPQIVGFWSDPAFARLDRVLHGNQDAFMLYRSLLGDLIPETTVVTAYFPIWLVLAYVYPAVIAAVERDETRAIRHIRLHMVTWILLGTLLALIFASGGPVYFGLITGQSDFDYISAFLQADQPAFAGVINLQQELWTKHITGALGSGISAFPSLHVAAATLPVVWLVDRFGWYGLIGVIYPALIQYGSVLTGFHYAVDGYVSVVVVLVCHALLKRRDRGAVAA